MQRNEFTAKEKSRKKRRGDWHVGSYIWGNKELRQVFSLPALRS